MTKNWADDEIYNILFSKELAIVCVGGGDQVQNRKCYLPG